MAQYAAYSCYSVWWGGHTYGPRYMMDLVVLLTPSAAVALDEIVIGRWRRAAALAALVWSLTVAAIGAFFIERWSVDYQVDRDHTALWNWREPQILYDIRLGPSPQNFELFVAGAPR